MNVFPILVILISEYSVTNVKLYKYRVEFEKKESKNYARY